MKNEKMEKDIDYAVKEITLKKEKKKKKQQVHDKDSLHVHFEVGRESPILVSRLTNRKEERREAVSEQNQTERKLVKQTLRRFIQEENVKKYEIL